MSDLNTQTAYWDGVAPTKTFTHPLHRPWLDDLSRRSAILDYGCGYGRTLETLAQDGFDHLSGVDTSAGMIARAQDLHPTMRFASLPTPPALDSPDTSIDVVILFAVLTCIPGDDAQRGLIAELSRVLKPGGLLYLSDYLLQEDPRSVDRYARDAQRHGTYGVFETSDGAVCRHHSADWFPTLLADFDLTDTRPITVATMNGHEATGIQILAAKPMV
jgi:SAM-dependent methyltransferase